MDNLIFFLLKMSFDFDENNFFLDYEPSLLSSTTINTNNPSNERRSKSKSSFIWQHCCEIQGGWECVVTNEYGVPCGTKFFREHTKGSTSTTLYHLQMAHNLIRPDRTQKVCF
jgi:hypothetical protein